MTARRVVLTSVIVALACALLPSATHAGDCCSPNAWMNTPGFGYSGSLYGLGYVPVPPYFSLHPPVYYGDNYYRSYGESPFPRNDYSSRPRRIQVDLIINPFFTAAAAAAAGAKPEPIEAPAESTPTEQTPAVAKQAKSSPQMIINPYYQPEVKTARNDY